MLCQFHTPVEDSSLAYYSIALSDKNAHKQLQTWLKTSPDIIISFCSFSQLWFEKMAHKYEMQRTAATEMGFLHCV